MVERFIVRAVLPVLAAVCIVAQASAAGPDKALARVKGTIGFQATPGDPFHRIVGREVLPDDAFAVTQNRSAAMLSLPDSSIVSLGEDTRVQVGAFNDAVAGPGATIQVQNGTLRFDIQRPQGGVANYRFTTTTSQLAVRGTVGLLSFINGQTIVGCLSCAADSVTLTVGTQTFSIVTGQVLVVSSAGIVTTGVLSSTILSTFSAAQVSTAAASGPAAATAGIAAAGLPAAAIGGAAAAAALGGVAASGAFSGPSTNNAPTPAPAPPSPPQATPTPVPTPLTAPLTPQDRHLREAHPAPTPSPVPLPLLSPPPAAGAPRGHRL